ncbi:HNH endonuclease [Bacillus toyonensis]|uniref:HNH endonuclease n=1 Tax=Bacillus toyonensis TaxID=155322 RepID=UPI001EDEF56A|nr:HNH endonuclease [Bacillus toyonensis]MCG3797047.1 HNH endonuclease [Bacillus toyonensis]
MKEIELVGQYANGRMVQVSDEDFDWLNQYGWIATRDGYAISSVQIEERYVTVLMHRFIMGQPSGLVVDHIDGNRLNNQRSNLRVCTQSQNSKNQGSSIGTSKYKGVHWDKEKNKWLAQIMIQRKNVFIGRYLTEEEAAYAYNQKAMELHGEFARLNPLPEGYTPPNREPKPTSSIYKGVTWVEIRDGWKARFKYQGKLYDLGYYETQLEAAIAYNKAVLEVTGDKSKLNELRDEAVGIVPVKRERKPKLYSSYIGVTMDRGFYLTRFRYKGNIIYCGRFATEIEAALAYDQRATELLGEEAKLNFYPPKEIPLRGKAGDGLFAIVDHKDYQWLKNEKLYLNKKGYIIRNAKINGGFQTTIVHREIIGAKRGDNSIVDHKNRNKLDIRRSNLRFATVSQNAQNSGPRGGRRFKGVKRHLNKWRVDIMVNGKNYYIGLFDCEIEGAIAFNKKAIELCGEFAWLNEIPPDYVENKRIKIKTLRRNNSSGFVGVKKVGIKWESRFQHKGRPYYLGTFRDPVMAALAYNEKTIEILGDDARLN